MHTVSGHQGACQGGHGGPGPGGCALGTRAEPCVQSCARGGLTRCCAHAGVPVVAGGVPTKPAWAVWAPGRSCSDALKRGALVHHYSAASPPCTSPAGKCWISGATPSRRRSRRGACMKGRQQRQRSTPLLIRRARQPKRMHGRLTCPRLATGQCACSKVLVRALCPPAWRRRHVLLHVLHAHSAFEAFG